MSNDGKLGLVLGVAIVVIIALVFFRTDAHAGRSPGDPVRPARVSKADPVVRPSPQIQIDAK
jgi:hypothetical protein